MKETGVYGVNGKPQVKRKLDHEVQVCVCRVNVILDLYFWLQHIEIV